MNTSARSRSGCPVNQQEPDANQDSQAHSESIMTPPGSPILCPGTPVTPEPGNNQSAPSTTPGLAQPWKSIWPPALGSDTYKRVLRECPDLLMCRFNVNQPFSRPWRQWTPSRPAGIVQGGPDHGTGPNQCSTAPGPLDQRPNALEARRMLDLEIHKQSFPSVVTNDMHHLAPLQLHQRVKPYKCHLPTSLFPNFQMTNLLTKPYSVTIFNIAGFEHLFTLAQSGFEFARFPVNVQQWTDQTVKAIYLPTLAQWLKKRYGAPDVHFYTYNFRYHNPDDKPAGQHAVKSSFLRAHCDASQETIEARLKVYYPDTYQQLLQGRVQYLNIWRPITSTPVEDCPLAVCDFRTIDQGDLVPMDLVYPHYVDEAYEVLYNPAHRWFYKKGMTHEDVVVFKLCDNLTSEAYVCPHAAFLDPTAQANAPPRASIEVKAILMG